MATENATQNSRRHRIKGVMRLQSDSSPQGYTKADVDKDSVLPEYSQDSLSTSDKKRKASDPSSSSSLSDSECGSDSSLANKKRKLEDLAESVVEGSAEDVTEQVAEQVAEVVDEDEDEDEDEEDDFAELGIDDGVEDSAEEVTEQVTEQIADVVDEDEDEEDYEEEDQEEDEEDDFAEPAVDDGVEDSDEEITGQVTEQVAEAVEEEQHENVDVAESVVAANVEKVTKQAIKPIITKAEKKKFSFTLKYVVADEVLRFVKGFIAPDEPLDYLEEYNLPGVVKGRIVPFLDYMVDDLF